MIIVFFAHRDNERVGLCGRGERKEGSERGGGDDFKASTLLTFEVCQGVAREKGVLFSSSFV